jgi:hypothetical protein
MNKLPICMMIALPLALAPLPGVGIAPLRAQNHDRGTRRQLQDLEAERQRNLASLYAELAVELARARHAAARMGEQAELAPKLLAIEARFYDRLAMIEEGFAEKRASALGFDLGEPPPGSFVGGLPDLERELVLSEAERYRAITRAYGSFDQQLLDVHEEAMRKGKPEEYERAHLRLRAQLGEELARIERQYAAERTRILGPPR